MPRLSLPRALWLACLLGSASLVTPSDVAAQADATPNSQFFSTSDGVQLHYLAAGDGPLLLFVPGWTMPAEIWAEQLADLARDFRVVALDPRSQGRSEQSTEGNYLERRAQDIFELIGHLGDDGVVVIAWSLAVPELLTALDRFGVEPIRGVVLVDGFVGADPNPGAPNPLTPMLLAMQRDRRGYTEGFVRSMFRKPRSEEYLTRLTQASLRTPTNTAFTLMANLMLTDGDWRPVLRTLQRPVLYVIQPQLRWQAEIVRQLVPAARVEVFEDAGHALFVDEPRPLQRTAARVRRGAAVVSGSFHREGAQEIAEQCLRGLGVLAVRNC